MRQALFLVETRTKDTGNWFSWAYCDSIQQAQDWIDRTILLDAKTNVPMDYRILEYTYFHQIGQIQTERPI